MNLYWCFVSLWLLCVSLALQSFYVSLQSYQIEYNHIPSHVMLSFLMETLKYYYNRGIFKMWRNVTVMTLIKCQFVFSTISCSVWILSSFNTKASCPASQRLIGFVAVLSDFIHPCVSMSWNNLCCSSSAVVISAGVFVDIFWGQRSWVSDSWHKWIVTEEKTHF